MEYRTALVAELPHLRNFARALTRDRDAADDLVQDALVKALQHEHQHALGSSLRSWLFKILHNTYRDQCRRQIRRRRALDEAPPEPVCARPPQEHRVLLSQVIKLIDEVTPAHSRTMLTAYALQFSYGEIAERLCMPIGTVRSSISRARSALERRLSELDPPADEAVARRALAALDTPSGPQPRDPKPCPPARRSLSAPDRPTLRKAETCRETA